MHRLFLGICPLFLCFATIHCAPHYIAGTHIRDTRDNQQIWQILQQLQRALNHQDANTLIGLLSPHYFEDNGTPNPRDDYGYVEMQKNLAQDILQATEQIHVEMEIHEIWVHHDDAYADIRYNARALLKLPSGKLWDSFRDFDRVVFKREGGVWKIVSGI